MSDEEERMKWRMVGCSSTLQPATMQCDFFAEFMRRRFPNADEGYAHEWAQRFARGEQFHYADSESKEVLLDIMLKGTGGGNAPHIRREDVEKLCKSVRR